MAYIGEDVEIWDYYTQDGYVEMNREEVGGDAYNLIAGNSITFTGSVLCDSTPGTMFPSYISFEAPKIIFNNLSSEYGISIWDNGGNSITLKNSSVNFDNAGYFLDGDTDYQGPIAFDGTSSINVTSNTNGKTIIKASTLTGTVTLDVEDGVQDGDTFLIEATDNQLVIRDGDWIATPSTSGNITTYTLAKAAVPKPKFRMLYTIG